jgi:hypothetical protein
MNKLEIPIRTLSFQLILFEIKIAQQKEAIRAQQINLKDDHERLELRRRQLVPT